MNKQSGLKYIFDQINILLESIDTDQYSQGISILENVSISKHLRHVYEFYKLIADSTPTHVIDYSLRQRNQDFENSIDIAKSFLQNVFDELHELNSGENVIVISENSFNGESTKLKSSYGRELMYAFDHAIHHLAIIKIGVKSLGIQLPKTFGVAPSTITYQNQN